MSYSVSVMMMKSRTGFFIFPSTLASSHIYDNVGGFSFPFSRFTERERQKSTCAWNSWWIAGSLTHISPSLLSCHSFGCAINSDQFPFTFRIVLLTVSQSIKCRRRRISASFLLWLSFNYKTIPPSSPPSDVKVFRVISVTRSRVKLLWLVNKLLLLSSENETLISLCGYIRESHVCKSSLHNTWILIHFELMGALLANKSLRISPRVEDLTTVIHKFETIPNLPMSDI